MTADKKIAQKFASTIIENRLHKIIKILLTKKIKFRIIENIHSYTIFSSFVNDILIYYYTYLLSILITAFSKISLERNGIRKIDITYHIGKYILMKIL